MKKDAALFLLARLALRGATDEPTRLVALEALAIVLPGEARELADGAARAMRNAEVLNHALDDALEAAVSGQLALPFAAQGRRAAGSTIAAQEDTCR